VDPSLQTRWGLSIAVISESHSLLFDTGPDGPVLLANMRKLGLEPGQFGTIVISHDHADHTGGLSGFMDVNPHIEVWLPNETGAAGAGVRVAGGTVRHAKGPMELAANVRTTGPIDREIQEQALVVNTLEGLVVITGCAHPGIVSILERVQALNPGRPIALVMGGLHLQKTSPKRINVIVEAFRRMQVRKVAPSHCTGEAGRKQFQLAYGSDYIEGGAGLVLRFATRN
jgi:7,8-dihydropterin-6-yl-methyl-4-(beta-D-ribofuranosyl)aminobenzene 5'-phosphate synthase